MAPDSTVMQAVEALNYRATAGDVATQAGLDVNLAERGLLALASEAGGALQVAESGDVVYVFPENFRTVLLRKSVGLRWQAWWNQVWRVLFFLIRISFGIVLLLLIVLTIVAIILAITAANSSRSDNDRRDSGGGGGVFIPNIWISPDVFWVFSPNYDNRLALRQQASGYQPDQINFLEAIFSFLFGDGNPNAALDERRWQTIATVIRNNQGAIVAEQIAPYLDTVGQGFSEEYEEYMLPVLVRFNGKPEVSPDGAIVYQFPDLQTTAEERQLRAVPAYLKEQLWQFSRAGKGQKILAGGLGVLLLGLAVALKVITLGEIEDLPETTANFIQIVSWVSLGYSIGYLGIPLVRFFSLKGRNRKIAARNEARQARAEQLNQADESLQKKLAYAREFAVEKVVRQEDLVYTTETDLLEQEVERSTQIDAEWQQRLDQGN